MAARSLAHYLEIADLSCARGDRPLFVGLNRRVAAGELLHVVGSNGSGKTTLLRTLCGLSRAAEGEVRWGGESIAALGDAYRAHLTYVGHLDGVQGELGALENLQVLNCAGAVGSPTSSSVSDRAGLAERADFALERMKLAGYRSFPAKYLSQGQKRRLALARLLLAKKRLWILDEPFTALDAGSCALVAELLAEHLAAGGIAILSSHQDFDLRQARRTRLDLDALRNAQANPLGEIDGREPALGNQQA